MTGFTDILKKLVNMMGDTIVVKEIRCPCTVCKIDHVLHQRERMARDACRIFGDILTSEEEQRAFAALEETEKRRCWKPYFTRQPDMVSR